MDISMHNIDYLKNKLKLFFTFLLFHRLCSDLSALIQERADIEKSYAKGLKAWTKKWAELIEKGFIF
jgi:Fes/CIP4, and EFC/F-BAR homology domain